MNKFVTIIVVIICIFAAYLGVMLFGLQPKYGIGKCGQLGDAFGALSSFLSLATIVFLIYQSKIDSKRYKEEMETQREMFICGEKPVINVEEFDLFRTDRNTYILAMRASILNNLIVMNPVFDIEFFDEHRSGTPRCFALKFRSDISVFNEKRYEILLELTRDQCNDFWTDDCCANPSHRGVINIAYSNAFGGNFLSEYEFRLGYRSSENRPRIDAGSGNDKRIDMYRYYEEPSLSLIDQSKKKDMATPILFNRECFRCINIAYLKAVYRERFDAGASEVGRCYHIDTTKDGFVVYNPPKNCSDIYLMDCTCSAF